MPQKSRGGRGEGQQCRAHAHCARWHRNDIILPVSSRQTHRRRGSSLKYNKDAIRTRSAHICRARCASAVHVKGRMTGACPNCVQSITKQCLASTLSITTASYQTVGHHKISAILENGCRAECRLLAGSRGELSAEHRPARCSFHGRPVSEALYRKRGKKMCAATRIGAVAHLLAVRLLCQVGGSW